MVAVAIVPLIVAIVGLLMYVLAEGKLSEVGRAMLWTGLLVTLLVLARATFKVG